MSESKLLLCGVGCLTFANVSSRGGGADHGRTIAAGQALSAWSGPDPALSVQGEPALARIQCWNWNEVVLMAPRFERRLARSPSLTDHVE